MCKYINIRRGPRLKLKVCRKIDENKKNTRNLKAILAFVLELYPNNQFKSQPKDEMKILECTQIVKLVCQSIADRQRGRTYNSQLFKS